MENTYHCYANRELSWLRFNERVLEEAEDSRLPLCERLSFLSIFQSNLDEFFMVRIGSLQDQMLLDKNARENKTNMTSGEQIDAALAFIHKLTARRDAAYNGLLEQLAEQGIRLLDFAHMEEESRTELEKLFRQDYLPLLSSFIISKKQAFPFLKNKGIYAVAVLSTKAEKKKIGIVPCGNEIFPRLVPVPGRTGCFILSEELILHFLPLLYKGYKVTSKTLTRITRNADIDADLIYDEDLNYRDHMAEVVKKRKKLAPVRLELSREIDEEIIQSLCKNLKLDPKRVFEYDSPLDHSFLFQIEDQLRSHTDLFHSFRHSSITYKLKLNGGDIKAVQGDSGHAQASMVTEQYAHILDDDRRLNAQRFDDFFYQHHGAEPEVLPRAEQSTPKASPVDTDAAAALAKLLADPSMATLIKNLAKNL